MNIPAWNDDPDLGGFLERIGNVGFVCAVIFAFVVFGVRALCGVL